MFKILTKNNLTLKCNYFFIFCNMKRVVCSGRNVISITTIRKIIININYYTKLWRCCAFCELERHPKPINSHLMI